MTAVTRTSRRQAACSSRSRWRRWAPARGGAHDHLPARSPRADRGRSDADRRGDDGERDRRLRRADRRRHLVRPPRTPPAVHHRWRRAHRRRPGGRRARQRHLVRRPRPCRRRSSTSGSTRSRPRTARSSRTTSRTAGGRPPRARRRSPGLVGAVVAVALGGALIEPGPRGRLRSRPPACSPPRPCRPSLVTRRLGLGEAARACEDGRAARRGLRERGAPAGRPRGAHRSDHVGIRLRRAARVLRALRRAQPRPGRGGGRARCRSPSASSPRSASCLAGRAPAERVHSLLVGGAALLGAGLLAAAPADEPAGGGAGLRRRGAGRRARDRAGLPVLRALRARGQAGRYSGVFFAGRSVASAAALPLAGLAVELTGSYRAVLWFGVGRPGRAACRSSLRSAERRPRARGSRRRACARGPRAWPP